MYRRGPYSGFGTRALLDSKVYNVLYRIILFLVVQYILPMMLLVILNARVVVALRHATVHRANTLRVESLMSPSQSHARSAVTPSMFESTRRVTLIVVVVVLLCIICHLVAMVAQVLWSLEVAFSGSMSVSNFTSLVVCRRHFARASNVLVTLNSAANFIIYCMCSRSFRAVLVNRCVCCCRRNKLLTAGQVGFDVRDGRNDALTIARPHRRHFLTVRHNAQTTSSSRRMHVSDERLLPSARQPVDVDRHHAHAGGNSNEVVEMKLITDCNVHVT